MPYLLQFDGGANPNPGPCAGAFVLYNKDTMETIAEGGSFIEHGTNNIGEYTGILTGLQKCVQLGITDHVTIQGDSLLVISQLCGQWKVKNEGLRPLYTAVKHLLDTHFTNTTLSHIRREYNSRADELSDKTLLCKHNW